MLSSPQPTHPLAKAIKECIEETHAKGRQVRLFCLRAHIGTEGTEGMDKLAKMVSKDQGVMFDYA